MAALRGVACLCEWRGQELERQEKEVEDERAENSRLRANFKHLQVNLTAFFLTVCRGRTNLYGVVWRLMRLEMRRLTCRQRSYGVHGRR